MTMMMRSSVNEGQDKNQINENEVLWSKQRHMQKKDEEEETETEYNQSTNSSIKPSSTERDR